MPSHGQNDIGREVEASPVATSENGAVRTEECVAFPATQKEQFFLGQARMENRESVMEEIATIRPTHVLLSAGVVGKPTVDWCESHQTETVRGNVIGVLNLVDVCSLYNIHVTYYATGCIYHYDNQRPEGTSQGFTEEDSPNFTASFYSKTKGIAEDLIKSYSNVLTLRLRLPIVADLLDCPRNFIFKILTYKKVVNIKNSMSVLPELLPLSIELARKKKCGILNFTNPGCLSHNEVLELYQAHIDPEYTWENFTLEEQSKILKAPRSNAFLDTTELQSECPTLLPIRESIIKFVMKPAASQKEEIKENVRMNKQR